MHAGSTYETVLFILESDVNTRWNNITYELQESVITTIVKFSLKSLQEFVRHQTFNRSGFQQIQLDIQYLRTPLKEAAEDEAAIDFLLDEVMSVQVCPSNLMKLYFLFSLSANYVAV